jgi:hypothetical protein
VYPAPGRVNRDDPDRGRTSSRWTVPAVHRHVIPWRFRQGIPSLGVLLSSRCGVLLEPGSNDATNRSSGLAAAGRRMRSFPPGSFRSTVDVVDRPTPFEISAVVLDPVAECFQDRCLVRTRDSNFVVSSKVLVRSTAIDPPNKASGKCLLLVMDNHFLVWPSPPPGAPSGVAWGSPPQLSSYRLRCAPLFGPTLILARQRPSALHRQPRRLIRNRRARVAVNPPSRPTGIPDLNCSRQLGAPPNTVSR